MDHTATMRRVYDMINVGDVDGIADALADDFVDHEELPGFPSTKAGTLDFFRAFGAAYPDLRMSIEDLLPSGDKVVARVRMTGTHQGEFVGMPATGKAVDVQLIDIIRFGDDGLAVEHWGLMDVMAMMQQLGAIPADPSA